LSVGKLKSRIDMKRMRALEIYCAEDEEAGASKAEVIDDIEHYFPLLRRVVSDAAAQGRSLAIWMA
jgi:hypothetical protein